MIVVIAEPEELDLVRELGLEHNQIIITGVGAINVIRALAKIPKDEVIFNVGYCGSNNIPIGTKVAVSSVGTMHEGVEFYEDKLYCYIYGNGDRYKKIAPCYTATQFVEKTNIKEDCVFDMELAYIAAMFERVYSIKFVSDNLNLEDYRKKIST